MSSSLVVGLTDIFKTQVLGPMASRSGETESSLLGGFEASVGTIIAGLASKMKQSGFARQAFDLISSPDNNTRVSDAARDLGAGAMNQGTSLSSKFMSLVFGGEQSAIAEMISRAQGLRSSTAASLLGVAAPLLMGSLGQRVREGGLDASHLTGFLSQEASGLRGILPAGIAGFLGLESIKAPVMPAIAPAAKAGLSRWLWRS